jgi:hypothetical protein
MQDTSGNEEQAMWQQCNVQKPLQCPHGPQSVDCSRLWCCVQQTSSTHDSRVDRELQQAVVLCVGLAVSLPCCTHESQFDNTAATRSGCSAMQRAVTSLALADCRRP